MEGTLRIQFVGYRITRIPVEEGGDPFRATYVIHRPDGTLCCRGVAWVEVERLVEEDRKRAGNASQETREK